MRPVSLSATAANVYESCPARYEAEMLKKVERGSAGKAASLGTACHEVMEQWVADGWYLKFPADTDEAHVALRDLYDVAYWKNFADREKYQDGITMLDNWLGRQDWTDRTVLSTESKRNFAIESSIGPVPFNYICDRVDQLDNGDIEVVDYKTVSWPVSADDLKLRIQPRAYALAAWLEHPEARRIWVTFDLLRFDPIGVVFTAAECEETLAYLSALLERIIADDQPAEVINNECRFCVRKHECRTLNNYIENAGSHIVDGIENVVAKRAEMDLAKKAIGVRIAELDELIGAYLTEQDVREAEVGAFTVALGSARRRHIDQSKVVALLPAEDFASIANVSLTDLDNLLKSGKLDPELASQVRRAVEWRHGARTISVRPRKGA